MCRCCLSWAITPWYSIVHGVVFTGNKAETCTKLFLCHSQVAGKMHFHPFDDHAPPPEPQRKWRKSPPSFTVKKPPPRAQPRAVPKYYDRGWKVTAAGEKLTDSITMFSVTDISQAALRVIKVLQNDGVPSPPLLSPAAAAAGTAPREPSS